jgi:integrase
MHKISVLFWRRHSKNDLKESAVVCRITVDGVREEFSTPVKVINNNWNQKKQRVRGTSDEANTYNRMLDQIKIDINNICLDMKREHMEVTAAAIVFELAGGTKKDKKFTILSLYKQEVERKEKLLGIEFSKGTVFNAHSFYKNMLNFVNGHLKVDDVPISKVDYSFITSFENWGRTAELPKRRKTKWSVNSLSNNLTFLKSILEECFKKGIIKTNPFINYSIKKESTSFRYLTVEEVEKIEALTFTEDEWREEMARDFFVFCCFTGLAYADTKGLSYENLLEDSEFGFCISTNRQKTNNAVFVPLLDKPLRIIEKYKHHPKAVRKGKLLPMFAITQYNAFLGKIQTKAGIDKKIRSHVGRHTAATYFLNNDIPEEVVCKALGIESVAVLRGTYGKLLNKTVSIHFNALNNRNKQVTTNNL